MVQVEGSCVFRPESGQCEAALGFLSNLSVEHCLLHIGIIHRSDSNNDAAAIVFILALAARGVSVADVHSLECLC